MLIRDVRHAAALVAFAVLAGCSSGTDAPVATTINVTPGTLNLVSLGAQQNLTAKVFDQRGDSMPGITVSWSSSASGVATVVPTLGLVTAVANGTATVTATAGDAHKDVTVTVAQAIASLTKSGDQQTGPVGAALGTAIGVRARDALQNAVVGVNITFAVSTGGGNVSAASVATNASGDASTSWTLGTVAAVAQTATATSGATVATFNATGTAAAAAAIVIQAGNNQTRTVGVTVPVAPSVKVTDAFGNAKQGVTVVFAPTAGGGSVTGGTKITDVNGIATVTSWTMGAAPGANTLSATVQSTAITTSFTATAVAAGAPATIAVFGGNNQTALISNPTNIRPSVLVTDAGGGPVAGATVNFAVTGGGGSVSSASLNTNAQGIAQVAWTVGAGAGANTMTATATAGSVAGNPITFTATGATKQYDIVIQQYGPAFSATVQAAFDSAEAAWENIIYGDQSDVAINTTNACGVGQTINTTVDDLIILATFEPIDGPGQILGSAGACSIRVSNGLAIYGLMRFDIADTTLLAQGGNLKRVILHEMGHVLGFSSGIWNTQAGVTQTHTCAQLLTTTTTPQDTHFNCPFTVSMFDSIGGTTYTGGNKVPLENCVGIAQPCGLGNFNSHWRELVFGLELMTPYFNGGQQNPFSVISITTFQDIGYTVNYAAAETYVQPFTAPGANLTAAATGPLIDLSGDELRVPVLVRNSGGQVVRVIQPR